MSDKSSSYWNRRSSSHGDDDDPDEEDRSYGKSTSPFYDEDDDDSAYSGGSYGGYGSTRSAGPYSSRTESPITRDDISQRRAQPSDPHREARPRPATGSSRFDRAPGKGSRAGSLGNRLSSGLDALRKRLPGGQGRAKSSSSGSSAATSGSASNRASTTRTLGLLGLGSRDRQEKSPAPAKPREKSAGRKARFQISLPFGLGKGRSKPTASAPVRETPRPPAAPGGVKRAKPLPTADRRPRVKNEGLSVDSKLDLAGIGLMALAAIIFFGAISGNEGDVSGALLRIIYQLVGVGWLAVPVALGGVGLWLILRHFGDHPPEVDYVKIVGWIVLYLAGLTTAHFIRLLSETVYSVEQLRAISDEAWQAGQGGGWVGAQAYMLLIASLGDIGTFIALVGWWIVGLILATDLAVADIVAFFSRIFRRLWVRGKVRQIAHAAAQQAIEAPAPREGLPASAAPALAEPAPRQAALPQPEPLAYDLAAPPTEERELVRAGRQIERAAMPVVLSPNTETHAAETDTESEEEFRPTPLQRGLLRLRRPASELEAAEEETETEAEEETVASPAEDEEYTAPGPSYAAQPVLMRREPPAPSRPVAVQPEEPPAARSTGTRQDSPPPAQPIAPASAPIRSAGPSLRERFFGSARLEPTPTPPLPATQDTEEEQDDDDYWEPPQPITGPPSRPVTPAQPSAVFSPHPVETSRPSRPAEPAAEEEEEAAFDPDFMKPAQPRNPNRVPLRYQPRRPGAGLSPAERAALRGDFAGPASARTGEEEAEEDEDSLADEAVVYTPLDDDSYTPDDEEPAIEIETVDADNTDDTSEGEGAGAGAFTAVRPQPTPPASRPAPEAHPTVIPAVHPAPRRAPDLITAAASPEPAAHPQPTIHHQASHRDDSALPAPPAPAASVDGLAAAALTTVSTHTWELPDFTEILEPSPEQNINDDLLLDRARIIEDTLASFGAPGKVVEVNPGPVITQFGVEPDYIEGRGGKRIRVKVQAIARLADDLALALAARSIRIEAPVPGKGFVGIEVPNAEAAIVGLRDIMESREFKRLKGKLRIGLGQSVDGTPVAADLTAMPHLLIAGTTGSGKSVCVNAIIASLLLQNTPDDLRMIMVDPKRVELTGYNGIPHLVAPVVVELERIVGVLKWVMREMDERYKKFNQAGARNIADFNRRLPPGEKAMPYLVIFIDELADLMILAPDETERVLTRLAQMSRATGIHLIISTQRPSVDIITGLIKANFPARIAFAVASSVDSRVILDQPGAERLLGRGDMLFQAPDAAAPLRMQGVFVSDAELNRMVRYWKGVRSAEDRPAAGPLDASGVLTSSGLVPKPIPTIQSRTEKYGGPSVRRSADEDFWDDGAPPRRESSYGAANDDVDEMYDEAVEVVRTLKKASVSLLQRQLRIGYTRAARLIDIMEERGVIGGAQSGSKPRKVIGYSDDEDFEDEET